MGCDLWWVAFASGLGPREAHNVYGFLCSGAMLRPILGGSWALTSTGGGSPWVWVGCGGGWGTGGGGGGCSLLCVAESVGLLSDGLPWLVASASGRVAGVGFVSAAKPALGLVLSFRFVKNIVNVNTHRHMSVCLSVCLCLFFVHELGWPAGGSMVVPSGPCPPRTG